MTITVKKRIRFNGQIIEESASAEFPITLDIEDVAIRILVMRLALSQKLEPMLPTKGEVF